jgi:hypothetical protein
VTDFRLRPRRDYAAPSYPSPAAPAGRAPMIANALRPFAPLAFLLVGASALPSHASRALTTLSPSHAPTLSQSSDRRVQRLSETEIESIVADLKAEAPLQGFAVKGDVVAVYAFLTEAEAKALLVAFLKKNGLDVKPLRLQRGGVDFEADAVDPAKRVAVEYVGPKEECTYEQFTPAETDLDDAEREELELLRARGEARVLVLDGRSYQFDKYGDWGGGMLTKRQVARKLLADLERFLEQSR